MDIISSYNDILLKLSQEGNYRKIPSSIPSQISIDLSTNDYMGLALRANELKREFFNKYSHLAMTTSASRLLASNQQSHYQLEEYLGNLYNRSILLFNSGYHANLGIISALNVDGTLWLSDKLIHASVIDGLRLARANCKRWRHNDIAHLRSIVEKEYDKYQRLIVICESIYSMDGDMAPLHDLVELKGEFPNLLLYVDEAHAIGVYGKKGAGLSNELNIDNKIDIIVGTFGKACASYGAFIATNEIIRDFLVNKSRSLIFSTALPPINVSWSLFMMEKLSEMDKERVHLKQISHRFKKSIERITGLYNPSESAIVPLITGDSYKAINISEKLKEKGIMALPIRRPTVPEGGERIRFSLNCSLSINDIDTIIEYISESLE